MYLHKKGIEEYIKYNSCWEKVFHNCFCFHNKFSCGMLYNNDPIVGLLSPRKAMEGFNKEAKFVFLIWWLILILIM